MTIIKSLANSFISSTLENQSQIQLLSFDNNIIKRCFGTSLNNLPFENLSLNSKKNSIDYEISQRYIDSTILHESLQDQDILSLHGQNQYCRLIIQNLNILQEEVVLYKKQHIKQRNIIVNWIALIHQKYQFHIDTLYQAVSIINRYLSIKFLDIEDYQKLGLTALWMAAKLQQRKVYQLRAWVNFGRGFNVPQLVEMQSSILQVLGFRLIVPNSRNYFLFLSCYYNFDDKTLLLSKYILELTLIDCNYTQFKQSQIALAAIYLTFKILNIDEWKEKLMQLCKITMKQVRQCASQMCKSIQLAASNQLSSIYRKYSHPKNNRIAKIKLGKRVNQDTKI